MPDSVKVDGFEFVLEDLYNLFLRKFGKLEGEV